jgi:putative inorganic carbon (hco3(-)) transporter
MSLRDQVAALGGRTARIEGVHVAAAAGVGGAAVLAGALATARPAVTLAGVVVLAVVGVVLARTDIAVLLLIATGPLEAQWQSGPGGIPLTKVAGALTFASFALHVARRRRPLVLEPLQAVVLAILGIALLSATQARELPIALSTAGRYASFVALYIVVSQLTPTPTLQRRIAWVLGIASTVSAALGIDAYFSGSQAIATLPYANANDFAFMLGTALPLMFWLLGGRRELRPVVLGMIGIVFAGILLSLSRGTLLGLGAGLVFLVITDRRRLQLTLAGGAIAVAAALLVIHEDPARFQQALFLKERVASYNVTTRFEAWSVAGRLAADHPALGVGPGNFRYRYDAMTGRPPGTFELTVVHDAYLDVGAELGVGAMVLFLVFLGTSFRRLTVSTRRGDGLPGFAQALRVSLVIALVGAVFLSEQYFLPFWLIGALGTSLWAQGERRQTWVREQHPPEASAA